MRFEEVIFRWKGIFLLVSGEGKDDTASSKGILAL